MERRQKLYVKKDARAYPLENNEQKKELLDF